MRYARIVESAALENKNGADYMYNTIIATTYIALSQTIPLKLPSVATTYLSLL